ncbi:hypothetical protein BVRB_7g158110 isoform A [Beta vulgaris subsp. vulgaris]|nr:hypothetical protein BVRB_7g158110 isoform A [Beta vulgaris subsp. vulgaris]
MAKIKDTAEGFNGVFRRLQLVFIRLSRVCYYPSMAKIKDTAEGFNGVLRRLQLGTGILSRPHIDFIRKP